MSEFIQQFHFLRPWWWLFLLPLFLIFIFNYRRKSKSQAWKAVCDPHLLDELLVDESGQ